MTGAGGGASPAEAADGAFVERIRAAPPPDPLGPTAPEAVLAAAPVEAQSLLRGALTRAPFLARTAAREAAWLSTIWETSPEAALRAVLDALPEDGPSAALETPLRIARRRAALLIALADLGGVWELDAVTQALSGFAETALRRAVDRLLIEEAERGEIGGLDPERSGFVVIAMGKFGACELNYSSDIDLIVLFDQDCLPPKQIATAKDRFSRLTRRLVRLLDAVTEEGYVARVDLRLRPDPGANAPCLAMATAEQYYESFGRTWERAAHIKARPVAGDIAAGAAYLERLSPFVWRRHLDFAALEDAADMLAKIRAHEGGAEIAVAGQDVKLGAGGIREIEFLAQTRQLILGGRDRRLRAPRTLDALAALSGAGRLSEPERAALERAYVYLRRLEHRLQMVEDRQTHRIPKHAAGVSRIASLMEAPDAASFERVTRAQMTSVRVIAGVDLDQPRPVEDPRVALKSAAAAFQDAEQAQALAEKWASGRVRAVRSPRARARIERLAPEVLRRMSAAADPERALAQFDRFLAGLPAGVQLLALIEAHPQLLTLLTDICATAPRLADALARRSGVLDAVLDPDFFAPPPPLEALQAALRAQLHLAADYERELDAARRWAAERRFQLGVAGLNGALNAHALGAAFSDVAEACLRELWPRVAEIHAERHGPPPGRGAVALAMGKLGSREMTAQSDIDLIVVYDAGLNDASDGPKPLPAPTYYARFTQKLVAAMTAPTAEGALYEVDLRLRPSGRSGPLATSLDAFRRYQREDAWIWEQMALTRARVAAGDPAVAAATAAVGEALARWREPEAVRRAAREMRGKMREAHSDADPWTLKHAAGGLVDLEFVAQTGALMAGVAGLGGLSVGTAFQRLAAVGALSAEAAAALGSAHERQIASDHVVKIALEGRFHPAEAGAPLRAALARALDLPDFEAVEAALAAAQETARAAFAAQLGAETPPIG